MEIIRDKLIGEGNELLEKPLESKKDSSENMAR